ncbi:MAG: DUF5686 and carboxypeptidase regulatory-like domain-containing protein [Prolixibacteraceae bacterium]
MKAFSLFILFFFFVKLSYSQTLFGLISDIAGESIPYATIFVKELNMGTTSNSEGVYRVNLPKGEYTLQFRSIGFAQTTLTIKIDTVRIEKNIVLPEQSYQLHEIRVYKDNVDPAYPIMRRAVAMAPYYLNQIKAYNADLYLKGTAKIDRVPKLIEKQFKAEVNGSTMGLGDVYVGESFSEIEYTAPDVYHQKIISSNMSVVSDKSATFDMGLITESPYQPIIGDNIISPLAPQSFANYNFRYEGFYEEGKYLVNKIKIIPKRKSKQLFSGYLYIIDGLWCLHGLDLYLNQGYLDLHLDIQLAEVEDGVLLPISHAIKIYGKMMGIAGSATYLSSIKYKSFKKNDELKTPALLKEYYDDEEENAELLVQYNSKRSQKIEEIMAKDELSRQDAIRLARLMKKEAEAVEPPRENELELVETYHVEKPDSAARRDEEYWNLMRPNPLSVEELKSYRKADSLMAIPAAVAVPDSTEKIKKKLVSKVLGEKNFKFKNDSIQLTISSLISPQLISFNAVEGWKYRQEFLYKQFLKGNKKLEYKGWLAYSFGRKDFQWNLQGKYSFAPMHRGIVLYRSGNNVLDYLGDQGISPFMNSISSLFFKENYARYLQQKFLIFYSEIEPINGVLVSTGFDYFDRKHLQNSTNFSFVNRNEDYHPNEIVDSKGDFVNLSDVRSAIFSCSVAYTPQSRYRITNGQKKSVGSDWPTLGLSYKKGIEGIFGSSSKWDYLELAIRQKVKLGIDNEFNYVAKAGSFLRSEVLAFADYSGIAVSSIPVEIQSNAFSFKLLPYYTYNANQEFVTIGVNYKSPNLALKYLPWFSQRSWDENLHFNYLSGSGIINYIELGYSLSQLFLSSELGIYSGFENGVYRRTAIRASLRF